ncbi:MAG: hypothetical protein AB9846_15255 [Tenuifilaceae bacterium]
MLQKIDKQWVGILLGGIVPAITFYAMYLFAYPNLRLISLSELFAAKSLFARILSLSVIPNIAIFFLFIWTNKLSAARGVLAATIIYALTVFAIKIFG